MRIKVSVSLLLEQTGQAYNIKALAQREKAGKISEVPGGENGSAVASLITLEFAHPKRATAFMKGMLEEYAFFNMELSYTY